MYVLDFGQTRYLPLNNVFVRSAISWIGLLDLFTDEYLFLVSELELVVTQYYM